MYVTVSGEPDPGAGGTQGTGRPISRDIKVTLKFSDGSTYDQVGHINFVDVTVDRATDAVNVRAVIANPKGLLIDSQLVRVILESGTPVEKVVIPQAALIADQEGVYVFVVDDGKAVVRRVKVGEESGTGRRRRIRLVRRRSRHRRGIAEPAARHAGARDPDAGGHRPGAEHMISAIFVDRPRLAIVISVVLTIAGLVSLYAIPVAQYPDIVPPQVSVTTSYPGANAVGGGRDRRPADRGAGDRRRQDDLHEERERRRRQLHAHRFVRARHRSRHQHRQRQQPGADRALQAAAGRVAPGHHGQEEVVGDSRRHRRCLRRSRPTIRCSSPTTSPSTCSIRSRARRASATPRCGDRRTTPCGPGCAPTGSPAST